MKGKLITHAFIYPMENYMDVLFSLSVQPCFHYKDQMHQKLPLHITILILWTNSQVFLLILLTSNQEVSLFQELVNCLHWNFVLFDST